MARNKTLQRTLATEDRKAWTEDQAITTHQGLYGQETRRHTHTSLIVLCDTHMIYIVGKRCIRETYTKNMRVSLNQNVWGISETGFNITPQKQS